MRSEITDMAKELVKEKFLLKIEQETGCKWDRFTRDITENSEFFTIFGWIRRRDGKRDFVVIVFESSRDGYTPIFFTTSSARYSRKIHDLLGFTSKHSPCRKFKYKVLDDEIF
ncbi:MAG: hypothetical protein ACTSYS_13975 [Promethearchaeota archaeon]